MMLTLALLGLQLAHVVYQVLVADPRRRQREANQAEALRIVNRLLEGMK